MALKACLLAGMLLIVAAGVHLQAQVPAQGIIGGGAQASALTGSGSTAAPSTTSLQTVPRVPGMANLFRGFNAGVNYSAAHSSAVGWYSVITPAVSYAFSPHYSADVSSSIYLQRKYPGYIGANPVRLTWVDEAVGGGDTLFGFHGIFERGPLEDIGTFTVSAPTGDPAAGLGTGHVTYDFTNHIERYRKQLGVFMDAGIGNSSVPFNNLVDRNYSTLGGLSHFLIGAENWFGDRLFLESLVYEQLPFGSQRGFAEPEEHSTPPPPAPEPIVSTGSNEDNGVAAYVGIPVATNLTLAGYYNRSFRRQTDTVSFGFTWVLRGRKIDSLEDRALKEAEKAAAQN